MSDLPRQGSAAGWRIVRHVPYSSVWEGGGRAPNFLHLYAPEGFESGRLKRPNGGALCGAPRTWYEGDSVKGYTACRKCAEIAKRHGITWPATFDERGRLVEVLPVGA